jgi:hypothetical protein
VTQLHLAAPLKVHRLESTRLAFALWGGLAVLDLARLVDAAPLLQLTLVAALVAACSRGVRRPTALCLAGIGWLLVNGFVVHRFGQLGFAGIGDLACALLLVGVALTAAGGVR